MTNPVTDAYIADLEATIQQYHARVADAYAVVSEAQRLAFDRLEESSGATRIQHEERTPEQQALVSLYSCIHDGVKRLAGRGDLELPTLDEAKVLVIEYRQVLAEVRTRVEQTRADRDAWEQRTHEAVHGKTQAETKVRAVRELHISSGFPPKHWCSRFGGSWEDPHTPTDETSCAECGNETPWPCDTRKLVDE